MARLVRHLGLVGHPDHHHRLIARHYAHILSCMRESFRLHLHHRHRYHHPVSFSPSHHRHRHSADSHRFRHRCPSHHRPKQSHSFRI